MVAGAKVNLNPYIHMEGCAESAISLYIDTMHRRLLVPGSAFILVLVVLNNAEGEEVVVTSAGLKKRPTYIQHTEPEADWISINEGTTMHPDEQELVDAMNLAESAVLDSMELLYWHLQGTVMI